MRFAMILLCLGVISPALPAEPDAAAVDQIFSAYDRSASPGCSLGVIRDGSFVYRHGYDQGSLELTAPLTSDHTSGFRDVLELLALSGHNAVDIHSFPELLDLVTRQKGLNFTPEDQFLYSNTNYFDLRLSAIRWNRR